MKKLDKNQLKNVKGGAKVCWNVADMPNTTYCGWTNDAGTWHCAALYTWEGEQVGGMACGSIENMPQ